MPLHPFFITMIEAARQSGRPPLSVGAPADGRALLASSRQAIGAGPSVEHVADISIPAPHGVVPARLYRPSDCVGLVVYLHGGGWVLGALDDFDGLARMIAVDSGAAVLLADYRLAPEAPFPAGLDDACAALRYAANHREELAPGARGLIVAGDSAGGNLAGVAALECRDVQLDGQILIYPVCDCDLERPSYFYYGEGLPLGRADMDWFFHHYVGSDRGQRSDPRISFLRRTDLSAAPPTLLLTAEYDVLADEGEALAHALKRAGVDTQFRRFDGLAHGFIRMGNLLPPARDAVRIAAKFARGRFTRSATQ